MVFNLEQGAPKLLCRQAVTPLLAAATDKQAVACRLEDDADIQPIGNVHQGIHAVDALMDVANRLDIGVVFQPARDSLFVGGSSEKRCYRLTTQELGRALLQVEHHKRIGSKVLN